MKTLVTAISLILLSVSIGYSFECNSWPFEGMPYFRLKTDTLVLYSAPSSTSKKNITVNVKKGSIVTFPYGVEDLLSRKDEFRDILGDSPINTEIILDKSIQKVIKPGISIARYDGKFIATESYGQINSCAEIKEDKTKHNKEYSIKAGERIEYLLYLGEGVALYRYKGEVFMDHGNLWSLYDDPFNNATPGKSLLEKISKDASSEWWISVKKNKKDIGWLKMSEKNGLEFIETLK